MRDDMMLVFEVLECEAFDGCTLKPRLLALGCMTRSTLLTVIAKLGVYELIRPHGKQLCKTTDLQKCDPRSPKWTVQPIIKQDSVTRVVDVVQGWIQMFMPMISKIYHVLGVE